MIKKKIFGDTLKDQLIRAANDRLYKFLMNGDCVRGVILNATKMINEMAANHELGILETLVLGHAYIAAGLLSTDLKGSNRIAIQVECEGPARGFVVESNGYNEVRGYLKNVPIPVEKPLEDFDLSPFFGAGFITVTKYLEDSKTPFSGTVMLQYGNIAQDLTYYFTASEQTPTSFTLSIHFNKDGNVTGAGGMFLQAMPGADEKIIASIEKEINNFPSIGSSVSENVNPKDLVREKFGDFNPEFTGDTRVEFMCRCSKDRMLLYLSALPENDIKDIAENGPFPVEITCHNCNTRYYFGKSEIEGINKKTLH